MMEQSPSSTCSSSSSSTSEDLHDACLEAQHNFPYPREVGGKLKKREKNRAAAQKSRQKQTERADQLHKEHECLEKDNSALRKEIASLTQELSHWRKILQEHESTCIMCCPDVFLGLLNNALPQWTDLDEGFKVAAN